MSEAEINTDENQSSSDDLEISNAELGLAEDHFSQPEGHFGMTTEEEIEMAIENCKDMILTYEERSEKRKSLVKKLIQLRMKLQEIKPNKEIEQKENEGFKDILHISNITKLFKKDGPEELPQDMKCVLGHHFERKSAERPKRYCEKCLGLIWGVISGWYMCQDCKYSCHPKCLNLITRTCASIKIAENPNYILDICPEVGLSIQNYRCVECRAFVSLKNGDMEPRRCDYTGFYYCPRCHWNSTAVIPARVFHNWDFERRKVCRASKQFLKLMWKKSVIRIQDINPMLYTFVDELNTVKELREGILSMKKYFLSCKDATENKLLLKLYDRQHFVENFDMYSMMDLVELQSGVLVPHLSAIYQSYSKHIKKDCEACRGKGFICELCSTNEVLFPFDHDAAVCSQCSAVYHRECYQEKNENCPKCVRKSIRAQTS